MTSLKLDIIVVPTYNTMLLGIADASMYPEELLADPSLVGSPTIHIKIPGFGEVALPFRVNEVNVFNSIHLGLSQPGECIPIPDGIYHLKYTISPAHENYVNKTIIRVDKLQEKFDEAFMKLDMMGCNEGNKKQMKAELMDISFLISGAIATANNCATSESEKLYKQADKMLNNFKNKNCS